MNDNYDYIVNQLKIAESEWQTYYRVSENMAKLCRDKDSEIDYLKSVIKLLTEQLSATNLHSTCSQHL